MLHLSFNWKFVIRCLMFYNTCSVFIQYQLLFSSGFCLPCSLQMVDSIMSCWLLGKMKGREVLKRREKGGKAFINRCLLIELNGWIKSIKKLWRIGCVILVSNSVDTHPRVASVLDEASNRLSCASSCGGGNLWMPSGDTLRPVKSLLQVNEHICCSQGQFLSGESPTDEPVEQLFVLTERYRFWICVEKPHEPNQQTTDVPDHLLEMVCTFFHMIVM